MAKIKTKHPSGKTQQEMAADAGLSLPTWKKHYGEQWKAECEEGGPGERTRDTIPGREIDRKRELECEKLELHNKKERMGIDVLKSELVDKDTAAAALARIAYLFDALFATIRAEFPSTLQGMQPADIAEALAPFEDEWRGKLADSKSSLWTDCEEWVKKNLRGQLQKIAKGRKNNE